MKLTTVTIKRFKNIVDPQTIKIEDDVTCLIGKNESGKTTILKALHRLNPANGADTSFDLTTEYPRWRLARDRRSEKLESLFPVMATFALSEDDVENLSEHFEARLPEGTSCHAYRNYSNTLIVVLRCALPNVIRTAASEAAIDPDDLSVLLQITTADAVVEKSKELAKDEKAAGHAARAKALTSFPAHFSRQSHLTGGQLNAEAREALKELVPKFFYFSTYDLLPGQINLDALARKTENGSSLTAGERTMVALLVRAGESPSNFLDEDYDSRKAELQASSADLTSHVFEYWTQNTDLEVVFDTDLVETSKDSAGRPVHERMLKVELRDGRHGGVETNFATRSSGFQWFFSFFAAFSEYQDSPDPIVVLLDEPGTSLHGEAQKDFLRFVFEELGASKQTLYTTHSQYLIDPARYEKLRAVTDRASRTNPNLGVAVGPVDLSADRDTVLPVESALGYSISQHLFLGGGHHLAVEGSSDFVYLQRLSEHLLAQGRTGLDPRLAIIPVGGADSMPAFVALLGRRLKVSALIDGDRTQSKFQRVQAAAVHNGVPESAIVVCAQLDDEVPSTADIEDLFEVSDYLRLYNLAFSAAVTSDQLPSTGEPIIKRLASFLGSFDHALPAHALTEHREEFFGSVTSTTEERFQKLFVALNETLAKS